MDMDAANLVLEDTIERIYHGSEYAEQLVGLFIIRGENVVLLGEIVRSHFDLEMCLSSQLLRRTWTSKTKYPYRRSHTIH